MASLLHFSKLIDESFENFQIEALRAKLETKNIQIEQKEKTSERLEADLAVEKNRVSDLRDSNRVSIIFFK